MSKDDLGTQQAVYRAKVRSALDYVKGYEGETHDGMFLMGLALAGLELIPFSCDISPKNYWVTAPEPKGEHEPWAISWMVELGEFTKVESSWTCMNSTPPEPV